MNDEGKENDMKKRSARELALEACSAVEDWFMPPDGDVTKLHGTERKLFRLVTTAIARANEEDAATTGGAS